MQFARTPVAAPEGDAPTRARVARTILENGPSTAADLARRLDLTPAAVRRHLDHLVEEGTVEAGEQRVYGTRGRGRPARVFRLTESGRDGFESQYDALAVDALRYLAEAHGEEAVVADTPLGTLGLSVCYDLRFPHLYRALAKAGAEILLVPAAFTRKTGRAHWHVLLRARAIETGAFVFAPAQCGTHAGGRRTYGHSLIVAPWGEILAEAGDQPGIVATVVDLSQVAAARGMIPSLRHDRDYARPQPGLRVAGE